MQQKMEVLGFKPRAVDSKKYYFSITSVVLIEIEVYYSQLGNFFKIYMLLIQHSEIF